MRGWTLASPAEQGAIEVMRAELAVPGRWQVDLVFTGVPARSERHGSLGWSTVVLIRCPGHAVLVDVGGPAYRPLIRRRLRDLGVDADEITELLLTHCHWDHVSNEELFPSAAMYMSAAELEWGSGLPNSDAYVSSRHVRALGRRSCIVPIMAEGEVLPGVYALSTPGHTPGHVSYLVQGIAGPLVMAGDAVKTLRELETGIPEIAVDCGEGSRSISRLGSLMITDRARLVLGHSGVAVYTGGGVSVEPREAAELVCAGEGGQLEDSVRIRHR